MREQGPFSQFRTEAPTKLVHAPAQGGRSVNRSHRAFAARHTQSL